MIERGSISYSRSLMYELTVETEFCAAHAIVIAGEREAVHGHNFRVRAMLGAEELDRDGLIVDFHAAERALREIVAPWSNADLNQREPFDRTNPTAELIARTIAERWDTALHGAGVIDRRRVWVSSVSVTEAPGCSAMYRVPCAGKVGVEGGRAQGGR